MIPDSQPKILASKKMSLSLHAIQSSLDEIQHATTLRQAKDIAARLSRRLEAIQEFKSSQEIENFADGSANYDGQLVEPGWERFSRLPHEVQENLLGSWGAPQNAINRTIDALPNALYQLYQQYHP